MKKLILAGTIAPLFFAMVAAPLAYASWHGSDPITVTTSDANSATVSNTNTATVTNTVSTSASTGGNTAYGGSATVTADNASTLGSGESSGLATAGGGTIVTGNALAVSGVSNTANINRTAITPLADTTNGNANVALGLAALTSGADNITVTNTSANSVDVTNSNSATINNPVTTAADTGSNTAYGGSGTASVSNTTDNSGVLSNGIFFDPFTFGGDFGGCNSCNTWFTNDVNLYNAWLNSVLTNTANSVNGADSTVHTDGGSVITGDSFASSSVRNYLNVNETQN